MEFDKSRVYAVLNAEKLKVGSKVICADTLSELKEHVETEDCMYTLYQVLDEGNTFRFITENAAQYALAYLVSEPEENNLRWIDLKIGDILLKKNNTRKLMVTAIDYSSFSGLHIYAGDKWIQDEDLKEWEKVEEDND